MKKFISTILVLVLMVSCLQIPAQAAWQQQNGCWYYTDTNGKPVTGWQKISDVWYYFNNNGAMQTGWLKQGDTWYFLSGSGAMVTGWQKISNVWYYFNNKGAMQTGWLKYGNTWYFLSGSGAMATGWQSISGVWYYFNSSGAMQTGWITDGENKYYLYSSGAMAANTIIDDILLGQSGKAVQPYMMQYYIDYCGNWSSTTQYHFATLFLEGGILYLDYYCVSGNASKLAEVLASVVISDITNNKATFCYNDDGWGNSGTLVMDFSHPNQITCTATTTYKDPGALWCINPGTYVFVR